MATLSTAKHIPAGLNQGKIESDDALGGLLGPMKLAEMVLVSYFSRLSVGGVSRNGCLTRQPRSPKTQCLLRDR